MYHLKKTLFRKLIILKIWGLEGSSPATIMEGAPVERRATLSVPSFTANWILAQKHVNVYLGELYSVLYLLRLYSIGGMCVNVHGTWLYWQGKHKLWESTLAKWALVHHNFHAELSGYQSLEDWKGTRDQQAVQTTDAFANLSSSDCWYADQQDVLQLTKFSISLTDLLKLSKI